MRCHKILSNTSSERLRRPPSPTGEGFNYLPPTNVSAERRWRGAPAGRARVEYMEILSPKPIPQHHRTYPPRGGAGRATADQILTDERIRPLRSVLISKFSPRERIKKGNRTRFPIFASLVTFCACRKRLPRKGNKQFHPARTVY